LNELSECQRRFPIPNSLRRSSRAIGLLYFVEIRNVGKGGRKAVIFRRAQAGPDRVLDFAEAAGKCELLLVVDRLAVERENRVLVHAGMDCPDVLGRERLTQVNAFNLADKARTDLTNGDGHAALSPETKNGARFTSVL
jgi:hypothetical protein